MLSSHRPPVLRAVIDEDGMLAVSGLSAGPLTADHDDPPNAYAELINLCLDLAEQTAGPVWLHADTPTGIWGMAVHVDGTTIPLPLELFDLPGSTGSGGAATGADDDPLAALLGDLGQIDAPPARVVLTLAADPAPGIRAAAVAELATWGDDPNAVVEADLDATTLAGLAECRLGWVRAGVAAHPATDPITLQQLAADPDPLIGQALAARADLPPELAAVLVQNPDPVVRAELGRNPAGAYLRPTLSPTSEPAEHPQHTGPSAAITPPPEEVERAAANLSHSSLPPEAAVSAPPPAPPPAVDRTRPLAPGGLSAGRTSVATDVSGPSRARTLRGAGRRRWAVLGMAGLVLVGAGTAMAAGRADRPAAQPTSVTSSTGSTIAWHGTWLPSGPDGPADPGAAVVSGFAHTPAGAALAAAHLSVRIDPYAGPASFTTTIREHTYGGDPAALLATTRTAYQEAARAAGVDDGDPIPTPAGRITAWAAPDWAADGPVTVHLLVETPTGGQLDYAIVVAWVDGDYRLVDPTSAGTFVTTTNPDPAGYTRF